MAIKVRRKKNSTGQRGTRARKPIIDGDRHKVKQQTLDD